VEFLVAYDEALTKKDAPFLAKHTKFPLAFRYYEYDMEARVQSDKAKNAASLIRSSEHFRMEQSYLDALLKGGNRAGDACPSGDQQGQRSGGPVAMRRTPDGFNVVHAREQCSPEQEHYLWKIVTTDGQLVVESTDIYDPKKDVH
jgi:hypothetical protein